MIKINSLLVQLSLSVICLSGFAQSSPTEKLNEVFNPKSNTVLVTAHRGDWRNTSENSIQALKNCVSMGVDIMELDLKKTKDGHLVIMHDATVDRTTTGKGNVSDLTLAEIKSLYLRSGTGHKSAHRVPTFDEILAESKKKIIIDVDKGYDYFPEVIKALRATGTVAEVIVNVAGSTPLSDIEKEQGPIAEDITIMVVVNMKRPDAAQIIESYKKHKRTIIQANFDDDSLPVLKNLSSYRESYGLWINSLWPEQSGNHDDDRAVEQGMKEETWGWLVKQRANMIQTDRPKELIQYLQDKKLHP
jgi:glycerophosphoryl diester phosphodiesterase